MINPLLGEISTKEPADYAHSALIHNELTLVF